MIVTNTTPFTSSHRLADFHWFGSLAAPILGIGPAFEHAIATLDDAQLKLLAEGDDRLDLLARWRDDLPAGWQEELITGAHLFEQLHHLHIGPDRNFPFKGVAALGNWLGQHKDLITSQLGVVVARQFIGHIRGWRVSETRSEGVKGSTHIENTGILAFTPSPEKCPKVPNEKQSTNDIAFEDVE